MAYPHRLPGRVFDALGDPRRRQIFELLLAGPMPVVELADLVPVSRPAVSQHLRVLKDAGLVQDREEGTRRIYSVHPGGLAETRRWFDQMWDRALDAFKDAAEAPDVPAPRRRRRR